MVILNRATRRVLKPTRVRLHSAVAGVAFALIAGLSAPAAAASIGHPTTEASTTTAASAASCRLCGHFRPSRPRPVRGSRRRRTCTPRRWPPAQQSLNPTREQLANAKAIMLAGQKMHLPARAWVIAIATSMQESQLKNIGDLGDANDHDSLGLFQQRPTSGWGTPQQLQDPAYSATAFYKGLTDVKGWNHMPLTDAAQAVQVSAFPDHYAKWEKAAGDLVNGFYGSGPYATAAAHLK